MRRERASDGRLLRRRILVVDDDPGVRTVFSTVLRRNGFEIATAFDGLAALDLLARERFAVVLLDCAMPRLDGLGVLRRLHDAGYDAPVILISGAMSAREEAEALRLGAAALLTKPPDLAQLVRLCRELGGLAPALPRPGW